MDNTKYSSTSSSANKQQNMLSLYDLFLLSRAYWRWYAVSITISLTLAFIYLLYTPNVYTRHASILVKEEGKSGSSLLSQLASTPELGLFYESSNVHNEVLNLKMPSLVVEVIQRLHLDYNYYSDGKIRRQTLYGSTLPIRAEILGISPNSTVNFTVDISEDACSADVSEFVYNGEDYTLAKCTIAFGDTLDTPAGRLVISASTYGGTEPKHIYVERKTIFSTQEFMSKRLDAIISDKQATIIDLTYEDVNIQRAEDVLNTLISISNENWVKDKNQMAVSTSKFIDERLKVIEQDLGDVENNITSYRSENLIVDDAATASTYMNQALQSSNIIVDINNQLYMVRYLMNKLQQTDNSQLLPGNSGLSNSSIDQQIQNYNEMVLRRNNLLANTSESNPLVVKLDGQISELRDNVIESLGNEQRMLTSQMQSQKDVVSMSNSKLSNAPRQQKYLLSVERQQKVKESLYLYLLQRREENELSQAFTAYNTRTVNPPMGSMEPSSPKMLRVLILVFIFSIIVPASILSIKELLNTKVRGRKDLDSLPIPFIGEIPFCSIRHRNWLQKLFRKKRFGIASKKDVKIVVRPRSRNIINEAFRVIRTNLDLVVANDSLKKPVIMFTSSNPSSGKSFLSANIAASFAVTGKRILIIDLDLRRATCSQTVNNPDKGISNYLSGQIDECPSYSVAGYEGMNIIPVGTIPHNPAELLLNSKLPDLIERMRAEYDYILLDCPPMDLVADTSIISRYADMTIFVVRAELMERDSVPIIERYYDEKVLPRLSLILNGTTLAHSRYGYHSYGSYGSYGGYANERS